ncbi:MAG: hypothetical protein RLZZ367_1712, partial [Bacteroidota bacterium]
MHLVACSRLINAGSAAYLRSYLGDSITTDIEGNPRRYNSTPADIGAYEAQRDARATNPSVSPLNTLLYYCSGSNTSVTVNGTGNNSYQWTLLDSIGRRLPITDDSVLMGTGTNTLAFKNPPLSYNGLSYALVATDLNGCRGYANITLNVFKERIYVDSSKVNGLNNGTSWANAYTSLTSALANAAINPTCHTEIWVAKGTYYPTTNTNRSATFTWPKNVGIFGGFRGVTTDTALSSRDYINNQTILSGDIGTKGNTGDNSYVVVTSATNITNTSTLDGFTITGGNGGYVGQNGAGMVLTGPGKVFNCNFVSNTAAQYGGAAWVQGDGVFYNCNFYYNTADYSYATIYITGGRPRIVNCNFKANQCFPENGGCLIGIETASPYIYNCVISGNKLGSGAGICAGNGSDVFVGSTTIAGNAIERPFVGATVSAAGILGDPSSSFNIANCIIWGNTANGEINSSKQIDIHNATVINSDFQTDSVFAGDYNYNTDPLFVDMTDAALAPTMQGNLSLQSCSYLIDKGDGSYSMLGQLDVAGNTRIYNNRIDIGAYEIQSVAQTPINAPASTVRDTAVCAGQDAVFSLPAGIVGTFTWQVNTGNGYTDITSGGLYSGYNTNSLRVANTTAAVNGARYRCKVASANGCYFVSQIGKLTVKPMPSLVIGNLQDGYCIDHSGQITLNAIIDGFNYYNHEATFWGRGLVLPTADFVPVYAGLGPDTLYMAYTNSAGCSDTVYRIVTVSNRPDVNATGYQPQICRGDTVRINMPAAVSYHWSTGDTTQMLSVGNSGTYAVTLSNGGVCTASNSYTITVNDYPTKPYITTSGATNICTGLNQNVTLVANGGAGNYLWSNGSTATQLVINENNVGAYTVSSYSQSPSCRVASDTITIGVYSPPSAQVTYTGPADLCGRDSAVLNVAPSLSYIWSTGQTSSTIKTSGGSYSVTVTDAHSCTASGSITVNNSGRTIASIYAPNGLDGCNGNGVVIFEAAGNNNIFYPVYNWYRVGSPDSLVDDHANGINTAVSGTYYVVIQTNEGCVDTSAPVTITVTPQVTVTLSPPPGSDICAGSIITANYFPGFAYRWYAYEVGVGRIELGQDTAYKKATKTPGNLWLELVDTISGCLYQQPYNNYTFTSAYSGYSGNVCANGFAMVAAAPASNTRAFNGYLWSNGDTNQETPVYAPGAYTVTLSFAGCDVVDTVVVPTVPVNATNVLSVTNNNGCLGSRLDFSAATTFGGTHPHYVWLVNGQNVGAADTSVYNSTTLQDGDTVRCLLISDHPCALIDSIYSNSQVVHLTGTVTPTATI